jgi:hypothetical protein
LLESPPGRTSELLASCGPLLCSRIIELLRHVARQAGLVDQAIRRGTHLMVDEFGEGVYERWQRKRIGANVHHIHFFGCRKSQPIKLRSLDPHQWSVLPFPHPQLCRPWQLLIFTRGAIGDIGAYHYGMSYDVLMAICELVAGMSPSARMIDRFVDDQAQCNGSELRERSDTIKMVRKKSWDGNHEVPLFDFRGEDCLLLHFLRFEQYIPTLEEAGVIGHLRDQTEEDLVRVGIPPRHARSIVHPRDDGWIDAQLSRE